MENRAHALVAGIFTLLLGAAVVAVGWWFTRSDDSRLVPYLVTTNASVSGLKVDAPVRYRGVDVGKVASIGLSRDKPGTILVRILIDPDTPIVSSTHARLGYLGVTGLAFIALNDDGKAQPGERAAIASIPLKPSILDSGEDLLVQVSGIAERLSDLLDDDVRKKVKSTLGNVERATAHAAVVAAQLEPAAKQLPGLMTAARETIGEAKNALGEAKNALGEVRVTLTRADELVGNVNAFALKLDSRLGMLNGVATTAEEVGAAARTLQLDTLPRINLAAEDLVRKTRTLDRVLQLISDQPQSLVFGSGDPNPGPGERGFTAPEARR
jgi:phospholipid/cholesterol/gamma-HCH transport system substrate-binding protein